MPAPLAPADTLHGITEVVQFRYDVERDVGTESPYASPCRTTSVTVTYRRTPGEQWTMSARWVGTYMLKSGERADHSRRRLPSARVYPDAEEFSDILADAAQRIRDF